MNLNRNWKALGIMAAVLAFVPAAFAQTSGTVALSGTVAAAAKLTSGGAASLTGNSGGGVTTSSAADAALATVVDLGDVGPANFYNLEIPLVWPQGLAATKKYDAFVDEWSREQEQGSKQLEALRSKALHHPMSRAEEQVIAMIQKAHNLDPAET